MKHIYLMAALGLAGLSASAATPIASASVPVRTEPIVERIAKAPASRSYDAPEPSFTADKAQFIFYKNFYKDDVNSVYQLVMTNCPDGFTDYASGGGTLPKTYGQLICAFLCAPNSENMDEPEIPAGTYTFTKTPGAPFSFGSKYGHYVDAFEHDGQILAWQMSLTGGTITITKEGKTYNVVSDIDAEIEDEATGDITSINVKATYTGSIGQPGPLPELPGQVYNMDIPNFGGLYDASQKIFMMNFFGTPTDADGFIIGEGDLFSAYIYYDPAQNNNIHPFNSLPGTYEYTDYMDSASYSNYHYLGGYWYEFGGMALPMGTYCAHYNSKCAVDAASLSRRGTIKISKVAGAQWDTLKFDIDLESAAGNKFVGSWTGNVADKIQGLDLTGIDNITADAAVVGLNGRIQAPENAKVFTLSGAACGTENLPAGVYIVVVDGTSTKVVVK